MSTSAAARHNLSNVIDSMTESELDQLPHGAIQLSTDGMVLKFNAYESNLANLEKKRVIGKNFFKDVAPAPTCRSSMEDSARESQTRICM